MSEHTPGPWTLEADRNRIVAGGKIIAYKVPLAGDVEKANATLVTAAPELLDALALALPYVEDAQNDGAYKPGAVKFVVSIIRAAIEKAEGKS